MVLALEETFGATGLLLRGADGEVIHAHQLALQGADGPGLRCELQPVVERAAFVRFKVAPGDMAEFRGLDQRGHGCPQGRKHRFQPRVKPQRFLVAHEKMIELHVKVRDVNGEPERVGGDFVDGGHGP